MNFLRVQLQAWCYLLRTLKNFSEPSTTFSQLVCFVVHLHLAHTASQLNCPSWIYLLFSHIHLSFLWYPSFGQHIVLILQILSQMATSSWSHLRCLLPASMLPPSLSLPFPLGGPLTGTCFWSWSQAPWHHWSFSKPLACGFCSTWSNASCTWVLSRV